MNERKSNLTVEQWEDLYGTLLLEGETVCLGVTGNSMAPFLKNRRDFVWLKKLEREPKRGDILMFARSTGRLVLHRVYKVRKDGLIMLGDSQTFLEGPINKEQVKAIAVSATIKGKLHTEKSFIWQFYRVIWNNLYPIRKYIIFIYKKIKKLH